MQFLFGTSRHYLSRNRLKMKLDLFLNKMSLSYADALNIGAITSSFCVMVAYHIYLRHVYKTNPKKTVYGLTSSARRVFIASIMYRRNEILAVQTLRNWIMMASAMASTAIIIMIGLIAFLSAVGTKSVGTVEASNPIRFETFLDSWFPVKVNCFNFDNEIRWSV